MNNKNGKLFLVFVIIFAIVKLYIDWNNDVILSKCGYVGDDSIFHIKKYETKEIYMSKNFDNVSVFDVNKIMMPVFPIYTSCNKTNIQKNSNEDVIDFKTDTKDKNGDEITYCVVFGYAKISLHPAVRNGVCFIDEQNNQYTEWEFNKSSDINELKFTKE